MPSTKPPAPAPPVEPLLPSDGAEPPPPPTIRKSTVNDVLVENLCGPAFKNECDL